MVERIAELSSRRHATAQQAARADMTLDTPERQAELAHAEQAVSEASAVVEMVRAEADAGRLRETIVRYSEIAKAIGPDGIRSKMLSTGMGRLNAGLGVLADVAGWPLVVGSLNGGITSDDRPISLCSESERWRAQASIQLTMAALTGSSAVVLDRADLLDGANRAGLARGLGRIVEKTRRRRSAVLDRRAEQRRALAASRRSRRGTLSKAQSTMEFVDCFYCGKIAHTNVWDETLVYVC